MHVNFFADGGALVESVQQGDASIPLHLPAEADQVLAELIQDEQIAAAVAAVFLAGVRAGERSVATRKLVGSSQQ